MIEPLNTINYFGLEDTLYFGKYKGPDWRAHKLQHRLYHMVFEQYPNLQIVQGC